MQINFYHENCLPAGVDKDKLHRWEWVYLHGQAEQLVPFEPYNCPPDIFLADQPLPKVDDGLWQEGMLRLGTTSHPVFFTLWSAGKVKYERGEFKIVSPLRKGLVCLITDEKGLEFSCDKFDEKPGFI